MQQATTSKKLVVAEWLGYLYAFVLFVPFLLAGKDIWPWAFVIDAIIVFWTVIIVGGVFGFFVLLHGVTHTVSAAWANGQAQGTPYIAATHPEERAPGVFSSAYEAREWNAIMHQRDTEIDAGTWTQVKEDAFKAYFENRF